MRRVQLLWAALMAAASMGVARDRRSLAGPTLKAGALSVTLDGLLPRPLYVLAGGTNFSARVTVPPTREAAAAKNVGPGCVANDTVVNVGCWGASDGGPVADKAVWGTGKSVPKALSAEDCCTVCGNHSKCAAWTWNGPKGNLYCYGCKLQQKLISMHVYLRHWLPLVGAHTRWSYR